MRLREFFWAQEWKANLREAGGFFDDPPKKEKEPEKHDDEHIPTKLEPAQEDLIEEFTDRLIGNLGGPTEERYVKICEKILRELLVRSERAEGEPDTHLTTPGPHTKAGK